jgi:ABC-type ATPase involved in cell division
VELNRLGTTVLIATHDLKLVSQVKAKTLHLEMGELSET